MNIEVFYVSLEHFRIIRILNEFNQKSKFNFDSKVLNKFQKAKFEYQIYLIRSKLIDFYRTLKDAYCLLWTNNLSQI